MSVVFALLFGGLVAWLALRLGLYGTWILLFQLVLASYVAIFLTPTLVTVAFGPKASPYDYAATLIVIAVAALMIGYGLSFACLRGRLLMSIGKQWDKFGAGGLGFLAGFLAWSFLAFAFCLTPLSDEDLSKTLGFDKQSQQFNKSYVCWWCRVVNGLVSSSRGRMAASHAVEKLLASAKGAPLEGEEQAAPSSAASQADAALGDFQRAAPAAPPAAPPPSSDGSKAAGGPPGAPAEQKPPESPGEKAGPGAAEKAAAPAAGKPSEGAGERTGPSAADKEAEK
jgi:hypothetical protein